jgi:hypothetical protein
MSLSTSDQKPFNRFVWTPPLTTRCVTDAVVGCVFTANLWACAARMGVVGPSDHAPVNRDADWLAVRDAEG